VVDSTLAEIHGTGPGAVAGVVLIARWNIHFGNPPRDPFAQQDFYINLGSESVLDVARRADRAAHETARFLAQRGVRTLFIAQAPEWTKSAPSCSAECTSSRAEIKAHAARSLISLRDVASRSPNVKLVELERFFCDATTCSPFRHGLVAYDDSHHLSMRGALDLLDGVRGDLEWLKGAKGYHGR
jgi:hypothetical protein